MLGSEYYARYALHLVMIVGFLLMGAGGVFSLASFGAGIYWSITGVVTVNNAAALLLISFALIVVGGITSETASNVLDNRS